MVKDDKRIRIITGHYGSGKTEFALNYALALSKVSKKVALGDLDIVNVYFRSRERKEELQELGVKVISSSMLQNSSDLPAISAEISTPVKDRSYDYVIDLGGNDVGTAVLMRLIPLIQKDEADLFMVVNSKRPETCTVEALLEQKRKIESASGLLVTGFVNNTNLIRETTAKTLEEGDKVLREASRVTGIPLRYTAFVKEIIGDGLPIVTGEFFPLRLFMRPEWM